MGAIRLTLHPQFFLIFRNFPHRFTLFSLHSIHLPLGTSSQKKHVVSPPGRKKETLENLRPLLCCPSNRAALEFNNHFISRNSRSVPAIHEAKCPLFCLQNGPKMDKNCKKERSGNMKKRQPVLLSCQEIQFYVLFLSFKRSPKNYQLPQNHPHQSGVTSGTGVTRGRGSRRSGVGRCAGACAT